MKQVIFAQLHEGFFLPGMATGGQFTNSLPPTKTLKDFRMNLLDSGALLCEWEEGQYTKSFTVAAANVKVAQHAPEKKPAPTPNKA